MNQTVIASFSIALLITICLLHREVKFRRSLQKLLHRLLHKFWRPDAHESTPSPRQNDPDDHSGNRL